MIKNIKTFIIKINNGYNMYDEIILYDLTLYWKSELSKFKFRRFFINFKQLIN